jgi:penicillin-binding protein 2
MASGLSFSSGTRFVNLSLNQRSHRAIVLMLITTALLTACGFRLAQLQLIQGQYQRQLAEQNRIRLFPIPSDRGNILDRKGRLLAANRLSRSVYLSPRAQSVVQWKRTAAQLSSILQVPTDEILKKLEQVGYHSAMPVRISRDLSRTAFIALAEKADQLPGVEIRAESSRYYPSGNLGAHVLGYISEATAADLKANPDYPVGMLVGQMGIERMENAKLEGVWGNRLIEVDAAGRELRLLGVGPAKSGSALQLTLDLNLQKTAEKALAGRRGAVVVVDVKTGAVLALASGPTFDPNLFTRRITQKEWQQLQSEDNPFLNRALQGYPPGSTFKVVTAAAGMQSGKFSPDSMLATSAYISLGGFQFHEHGSGYGVIGFQDAFAYSSNTFFYQVGLTTGPEEISKWGHRLGIGTTTDLGLDGGNQGAIPTPAEKQKLYGEPWYAGDTVSTSIGQGLVQVTPLEMAVVYAAIANGGWRVKPHLLASQTNTAVTQREKTGLAAETIATIRAGLTAVVQRGTARQLSDGSIPLTAGKTGTAEVPGHPDNALYAGFGPVTNPQIAVAVVVENGGFGAVSAVPIAHEIYKTYFNRHQ